MTCKLSTLKFLNTATLVGWSGVLIIDIFSIIFTSNITATVMMVILGYVIIGLPIAYIACFVTGWPILTIIQKNTLMSLKLATIIGIIIGTIFGSINAFLFVTFQTELWIIIADWASTVIIGGAAGYIAFKRSHMKITPEIYHVFD